VNTPFTFSFTTDTTLIDTSSNTETGGTVYQTAFVPGAVTIDGMSGAFSTSVSVQVNYPYINFDIAIPGGDFGLIGGMALPSGYNLLSSIGPATLAQPSLNINVPPFGASFGTVTITSVLDATFSATLSTPTIALAHLPAGAKIPASVTRADDLSALAEKLGIDAAGLGRTVARFNEFARSGIDADFHRGDLQWRLANGPPGERRNSRLGSIAEPPFYGIELHPSLGTSSAGLLANAHAQVLHQRRHPIPGLYASGVAAARTELGAGYQAGLNLASAMTFSWRAVQHMRQRG